MKPSLLIVGLGNVGKQYAHTRHNVGFMVLDTLATVWKEGEWQEKPKFSALIAEARIQTFPVLLVKPTLYMNRSGETIRALVDFYKLNPATQVLVIVDDIDLPIGTHRFRIHGGPGTHNGMKSIVACIGEDVPRLRIGIGPVPTGIDLAQFVLSNFTDADVQTLQSVFNALPETIVSILYDSVKK